MSFESFSLFPQHVALRDALIERGFNAALYQDGTSGGLLTVRICLTADTSEYAPHILLCTEGTTNPYGGVEWFGCLYGFGTEEDVYDVSLDAIQRAGDDVADVARRYSPILRLLIAGGEALIDLSSSASRQHHIDTGNYLLQGESLAV